MEIEVAKFPIKSINDSREYKSIILPNQLQVLLIYDSKTDKSATSLDVNVGQIDDGIKRYLIQCKIKAKAWLIFLNTCYLWEQKNILFKMNIVK